MVPEAEGEAQAQGSAGNQTTLSSVLVLVCRLPDRSPQIPLRHVKLAEGS